MRYRSLDQIAAEARFIPSPSCPGASASSAGRRRSSGRGRAACARSRTSSTGRSGSARRAGIHNSPISVAFADPELRAAGLKGDTIGDAVEFFGLSFG